MTSSQEMMKLADEATREIHGDDYRIGTRLIIERAMTALLAGRKVEGMPSEPQSALSLRSGIVTRFNMRDTVDYIDALRTFATALLAEREGLQSALKFEIAESNRRIDRAIAAERTVARLTEENERLKNGFRNLLTALDDAPGLPLEIAPKEDLEAWTGVLTGILMALGVLEATGKPQSMFEALTEGMTIAGTAPPSPQGRGD